MRKTGVISLRAEKAPVVELDSEAHAAYVRFSSRAVAQTKPVTTDKCIVTVDFDSEGGVVGIELVGVNEFGINALIKKAGFGTDRFPHKLLDRVRYIPANLQHS